MADPSSKDMDQISFGTLSDSLGFLLRLAQLQNFAEFYDHLGTLGLRPGAFSVLLLVAENPGIRQGLLARALMIKRAHMTKMIRAMEAEGLVHRTVPDTDRRSVALWPTDAGRRKLADIRAPFAAFETRATPGLTAPEERQMKQLLQKYLGLAPASAANTPKRPPTTQR